MTARGVSEASQDLCREEGVKIGVLMVWHKQDGNWKLLARQAVRLEEPRTN